MEPWVGGLINTIVLVALTALLGLGAWVAARLFSHSSRISKVESALKPLFDAIDSLGTRANKAEDAHMAMTRGLGALDTKLATLDERSFAQGKTLDGVDRKLEQLFTPTNVTPRPRGVTKTS